MNGADVTESADQGVSHNVPSGQIMGELGVPLAASFFVLFLIFYFLLEHSYSHNCVSFRCTVKLFHYTYSYILIFTEGLSCVQLLATPWTAVHQAPPSMVFSRHPKTFKFHLAILFFFWPFL